MNTKYHVKEDKYKRWLDFIPEQAKARDTILVLPGLNNLHSMDCYAHLLATQGHRARIVKYIGQRERSTAFYESRPISTVSVDDWIDNLEEACNSLPLEEQAKHALVYSIGASLLKLLLIKNPNLRICSVFALAPALTLTKKTRLVLNLYRIISLALGRSKGIFPSLVLKEFRAEDFMSYDSYIKPKLALDKIHTAQKNHQTEDRDIAWTIVIDCQDYLVNSCLLEDKLKEFSITNVNIHYVKGFGHEFGFKTYSDFPSVLRQRLDEWLSHMNKS